ncbi:MAG TPA: hypothetical protein VK738_17585 [Terriglobales bacterium]|jgi:hypothetical protein|nr:hypothetical protein [Terriglobales bacterium]
MGRSSHAITGINLLWLALALNGLVVLLAWFHGSFRLVNLPVSVLVFVFWWFITAEVSAGRAWARIVYLALTVLEALGVIGISLVPTLASWLVYRGGVTSFLEMVRLVLQVAGIAILLINTPRLRGT